MKGCLGSQGWHYIILFFFSTSGVMQLFSGGQLTTNYLLNREVKPLDLNLRLSEWRCTGHSLAVHSKQGPTSLLGFASWGLVLDGRFQNLLIILCTLEGIRQDWGFLFLSPLSEALYNVGLESFWWLCGLCLVHFLGSKHSWTVPIWLSNGRSLHIIQSNWVNLWPEIYAVGMQCCIIKH